MVAYSNKDTMERNANIFWAQFSLAMIIGPLYVFFTWHGKDEIKDSDRMTLYSILTGLAGASIIVFALLRQPSSGAVQSSSERGLRNIFRISYIMKNIKICIDLIKWNFMKKCETST